MEYLKDSKGSHEIITHFFGVVTKGICQVFYILPLKFSGRIIWQTQAVAAVAGSSCLSEETRALIL